MRSTALTHNLQRLFHLRRVGGHFETPRYLLKWLFISSLIGLVAGVGGDRVYTGDQVRDAVLPGEARWLPAARSRW